MAAAFTALPAVQRLGFSSLLTTLIMVGVSLSAAGRSFVGLAMIRRRGTVAAMRGALMTAAGVLVLIGWTPEQTIAIAAFLAFGAALSGIDVSVR